MSEEGIRLTPEQKRLRRARSLAIGIALAAMVGLIYWVTVVRLGANVLNRPL
ncbi:hypothetical protein [Pannonibacter tanglangensis]|uniref:hypothetical protein n=1 Tax=Pannonibacter tanglangensis TaxID=2750084 RepID=UPI0015D0DE8E|nr:MULTISPECIES: hypothetical protein [unclassified Pannonibacter]